MLTDDWRKTHWQDNQGNRTTIHEVLLELQNEPIVSLKIHDLSHVPSVTIEGEKKERADLSFPIIVIEKDGEFQSILDGHHRRQKAIDENKTHILAKILRRDVINANG